MRLYISQLLRYFRSALASYPGHTPLIISNRGLMAWLHSQQKLSPDKILCFYGYATPCPSQFRRSNVSLSLFILSGL